MHNAKFLQITLGQVHSFLQAELGLPQIVAFSGETAVARLSGWDVWDEVLFVVGFYSPARWWGQRFAQTLFRKQ